MTEVIAISPQPSGRRESRRKITPPIELYSPSTKVVISPAGSNQFSSGFSSSSLFPGLQVIESRKPLSLSHAHPNSTLDEDVSLPSARHIVLPFNLHTNPSSFGHEDNCGILMNLFPHVDRVDFDNRVLVFHFSNCVPCYFTGDFNDEGPIVPVRRRSFSRIHLADDLDLRDAESEVDRVFKIVRDFFETSLIEITEIQIWGHVVVIVLLSDNPDALNNVPRSVASCKCFYLLESEMSRPQQLPAFSATQNTRQADTTSYVPLRPGVIISSGHHSLGTTELLTSSGILVKDSLNNQYMTVAAHGFPGHPFDGNVYHPNSDGKVIGEIIMELTHTDVALVKLNNGIHFENKPFENILLPAAPFPLKESGRANTTRIGDSVYMDSPFSGFVERTMGAQSMLRVPSDDPNEPIQNWIRCQWSYMGQGSNTEMVDGMCGSAIWDEEHRVLGFFRYASRTGHFVDWCMTVAADHLINGGYKLV
ncbi:hypothetical protein BDW59DRAFT_172526 [Aspergillus cavernicola]|uniref:Uncharacterized protein n=1 Tax=Aspergillus cavernicola TaxID=176166 RepID=A0ABR4IBL3_9EURO